MYGQYKHIYSVHAIYHLKTVKDNCTCTYCISFFPHRQHKQILVTGQTANYFIDRNAYNSSSWMPFGQYKLNSKYRTDTKL